MSAPSLHQVSRWAEIGQQGLDEMQRWLAANPQSPYAPPMAQIVAATQAQLTALNTVRKQLRRLELLTKKATLQAEIDAINQELGP